MKKRKKRRRRRRRKKKSSSSKIATYYRYRYSSSLQPQQPHEGEIKAEDVLLKGREVVAAGN